MAVRRDEHPPTRTSCVMVGEACPCGSGHTIQVEAPTAAQQQLPRPPRQTERVRRGGRLIPSREKSDARRPNASRHGRMKRLADDFLPKPRILHPWPEQCFAVKHLR